MKLLIVTTFYPSYIRDFYAKHPGLAELSFFEQKAALDFDAFGWADYWSHALAPLGYDVLEVSHNVEQMQRAWAKENSLPDPAGIDIKEIALAQARKFRPDVLWFDDDNEDLLERVRTNVSSIKLVMGWIGSAVPQSTLWKKIDLILSCAPESVDYFSKQGLSATHINHGFDPRVNERLIQRDKTIDFSFIGQLLRFSNFHLKRCQILEKLSSRVPVSIFSPSEDIVWIKVDDARTQAMATAFEIIRMFRPLGVPNKIFRHLPIFKNVINFTEKPFSPVSLKLKPFIRPAVFGLAMFQVLRDSRVTLNIHADSSPLFASNMRLFETTGVGTCMVVDWKKNLHELFEEDKEIVTYKTVKECVDKVLWLLNHPNEREEIARAGQMRTLKETTFDQKGQQTEKNKKNKMSKL